MKIQSFGCSFLAGDELQSPKNAWPAIVAQRLSVEYENHTHGGAGNLHILKQILNRADLESVCVINWTYIDRFDFCNFKTEQWETLRPSLDHDHAKFYFANIHGQYRDILCSLIYVKTAIDFFNQQQIPFFMTYMDNLLFDRIDPNWHESKSVDYLQDYVRPFLTDFDGKNFLDWSIYNGFPVGKNFHPLDQAHLSAADYCTNKIRDLIE